MIDNSLNIKHMFCHKLDCNNLVVDYKKISFRNYSGYKAMTTIAWCDEHNLNGDVFIYDEDRDQ